MSEQPQPAPTPPSAVPARLREVARLLRDADHLGPDAQKSLADLADELANTLGASGVPSAEEAQLGQLAGQLIQALHQREDSAPVAAKRHRLQEAILAAETRAPFAAGLARQLLDAIANLGI
ncbi:MAG TPA: DUF4404 family protein [Gemmataceae bacterium]|nr:DUF4404 family protein [Gemmataceae bacterium]